MTKHLADLSGISRYEVRIEFTNPMQPREISTGQIPLVSVALEIEANSLTNDAAINRKQYGRIPYGAPLYWWEAIRSVRRGTLVQTQLIIDNGFGEV